MRQSFKGTWQALMIGLLLAVPSIPSQAESLLLADAPPRLHIVGHRGLMLHAPENTLAGFAACMELGIGFELDIRRTKDGVLVCLHDEELKRTTTGKGSVADWALADLKKLDAGDWFGRAFAGQRVPTLEEVFVMLKERRAKSVLVALDIKIGNATLEGDVVQLAKQHGVLSQVVCIGLAIGDPTVRKKLRTADAKTPVAVLAPKAEDVAAALEDAHSDWVYVRFIPTAEQVARIHQAGKRVFQVGTLVSGREPENWLKARDAGVDAILTDYPLDCRQEMKKAPR